MDSRRSLLTALLTSKILGFTVPSDPKPIWLLGLLLDQLGAAFWYFPRAGSGQRHSPALDYCFAVAGGAAMGSDRSC